LQLREVGPGQAALCGKPCRRKKQANLGASHAMSKPSPRMPTAVQQTPQAAGAAGAAPEWTVGALCLDKYYADGKFYPAQVAAVSAKGVEVAFTAKLAPASPKLGAKPASPRSSPKFSPFDPVKQEALALLQPALLKDSAPLKFSQFVSDRGAKCLIDLGLMSIIQDAAKNKKLTVQREGAMYILVSLCSVVDRNGESLIYSNASYRYPYHAVF
jgi:hypothetical protein